MKRKALVLLIVFSVMSLLLVTQGCDLFGLGSGATAWTLGGTVDLTGVTDTPIKIGAYYSSSASPTIPADVTLVSDVATVTDGAFTLEIDAGDVEPEAYDYIHILIFADLDGDGTLNTGDKYNYVEPSASTDTAFANQSWAYYYYYTDKTDYNDKGWCTYHDGAAGKDVSDTDLDMYYSSLYDVN